MKYGAKHFLAVAGLLALPAILMVSIAGDDASQPAVKNDHRNIKRFGAVGDGKTDDTAAIQKAVDAGVGAIRFPRGVYRITKTIVIDLDRVGFTSIVGDGAASIVMARPGPALRFIGTHGGTADPGTVKPNVWKRQRSPRVDGVEIVGGHEKASGIEAVGTMQLTITGVVIRKSLHGIHLVKRNRNVIISNCHIYENRGSGIFYDNVNLHQSNIVGSHISYNEMGGVVVRGGNVRNIHIGTCDIEGNMAAKGPPTANVLLDSTGGSIGEVAIVGCTIQHTKNAPESANIRINGKSTKYKHTDEQRLGHVTIADNVLSDVQINIDLENTRSVAVTGNTMWQGFTHDLRVRNSSNIVVANNMFDRNPRYYRKEADSAKRGMVFTGCSDCTISGNHSSGTGDIPATMILRKCRRFNISGCTLLDYPHAGFLFEDVSDSRVSDCLIRSDSAKNVKLYSIIGRGGRGNMITDNLLGNPPRVAAHTAYIKGNYDGK